MKAGPFQCRLTLQGFIQEAIAQPLFAGNYSYTTANIHSFICLIKYIYAAFVGLRVYYLPKKVLILFHNAYLCAFPKGFFGQKITVHNEV